MRSWLALAAFLVPAEAILDDLRCEANTITMCTDEGGSQAVTYSVVGDKCLAFCLNQLDAAEADAVAGAKAAAEKEAGLHKAIAALTRIEDAERQLRAARAARRAKAKEKAADSLCATRS